MAGTELELLEAVMGDDGGRAGEPARDATRLHHPGDQPGASSAAAARQPGIHRRICRREPNVELQRLPVASRLGKAGDHGPAAGAVEPGLAGIHLPVRQPIAEQDPAVANVRGERVSPLRRMDREAKT